MPTIEQLIDGAKIVKEVDWTDSMPILHLHHVSGHNSIIGLPEFGGGPEGWSEVGMVVTFSRVADGPLENAAFITDARMVKMEPGDQSPPQGNLQERWEAGDREGIVEALMVMVVHGNGSYESAHVPYDAEARVWLEDEMLIYRSTDTDAPQMGGGMLDALRLAASSYQPDGTFDNEFEEAIQKGHESPMLRLNARIQRGEPISPEDLAAAVETLAPSATPVDLDEEFVKRVANHSTEPIVSPGVSIEDYVGDDD